MKQTARTSSVPTTSTWIDLLRLHARTAGKKTAFSFQSTGEEITATLTYGELDRRARAIAVALQAHCAPGDRALLIHPSGLDFITAFFGCLYAGVVAVPAYPPRANESVHRLKSIVGDAGAHVALTTRALLATSAQVTPANLGDASLTLFTTEDVPDDFAERWTPPSIGADTLAFLQYTSGSTGAPKGVMLTHGNLLANEEMIRRIYRHDAHDVIAGWLPLFHDMGLIGIVMQTLYVGATCLLMPPAAFLQKPLRWLQLISKYRVTSTGAPNFAYELCVRRTSPEDRATLDLSSLRIAFNGSEPIHAATLELFAETFSACGFNRDALLPCYGMAEASLLVSGKTRGQPPVFAGFDPVQLSAGMAATTTAPDARTLVSSGRAAPGLHVAIVDPATRLPCTDGAVGEIWVRGPSIGTGYWNKTELSAEIFGARLAGAARARHLRTGDLGFLRDGELFVTGRIKDLIIVRGRNHYPQDLEATTHTADPALRAHGSAAFAVADGAGEGLVIVQEVERTALRRLDAPAVIRTIREALIREHEIIPTAIVLVKPATLPKTSSGKIQRATCRKQFLENLLEPVGLWHRAEPVEDKLAAPIIPAAPATSPATPSVTALQTWLTARVAAALNQPAVTIDLHAPLQTLGLDSLAAVTLSGELEAHLGRSVAPTVVYDFPTIAQLAAHFAAPALFPAPTAAVASVSASSDDRAIAIIGLGCRFPGGAVQPEAFWNMLRAGTDAVGDIPSARWDVDAFYDADPKKPGRMYVRRGAFLDSVDGFDPEFFGISPREAAGIDPQHRLLLELAWEALEHAAIAPSSLSGQETGVFVGVSFDDYARLAAQSGDPTRIDAYSALGAARSLAAARLSYHLGLQGPSLLVDTLCSSSLLAVHLAMQSLRAGECRTALAGGANLILTPDATIASCKLRALAPDGRCKTFDASANGYARGEGAGLVVLKRLRDALADGDPILAVLRGSAVNHDGKSNGLTAPNGLAQEALLRRALADAGAAPADVTYIEAHGTGTVLGDPIEVQAIGRVYGPDRPADAPLLLGAVKSNVGHLESAAGVAGLIKTVLALQHAEIPANLHFTTPNPYIPWDRLPVRIVDRTTAWPAARGLGGVSSFGLGGTNVHVLLEAPPARPRASSASFERPRHLFTVSGHTSTAAAHNAAAWAEHLSTHPELAVADVCHTANTGRTAGPHRAALTVGSSADLIAQLRALTPEKFSSAASANAAGSNAPAVAFLFTGQGSHYAGMASELYSTHPDFRASIDACTALFASLLPTPLTTALFAADDTLLGQTLYAQPALFAVELALGRLWLSWGVRPASIFGHSIGEYAAACLAGVFSLEDAARLVAAKARLTHGLPANGAMLAAAASPERLAPHLAAHPEVEIAAFNGPSATTLAGPASAITRLLAALEGAGIGAQRLAIAQAFHSRALDPILAEFAAIADSITYHAPTLPFVTCLHGRIADAEVATARYWVRQMREPVQFTRGIETLARDLGCTAFIELGPKPSLTSLGQTVFPRDARQKQFWLPSLRPGRSDWTAMLAALGELYTRGVTIDWAAFDRAYSRRRLSGLPTYAFQRRRYWLDVAPRSAPANISTASVAAEPISTFSVHWHETPPTARSEAIGEWWLISTDAALADTLSATLSAREQSVRRIAPGAPLPFGTTPPRGVIAAAAPPEVIALARLIIDPVLPATPLWIVTQHAVATGRELAPLNLAAAPLTGFARAFALEHSAHWGGLLDIDEITSISVAALTDELLAVSHDDFVVWRKSARLVPRLLPHALGAMESAPISAKKTHLITGGTGGLGLAVARWLITRGARHIALMSRRAAAPEHAPALAEFAAAGVNVRALTGDVTVAADVARVLAEIEADSPSLGGVFHAAGIPGFEPLATLTPENFSAVLAPKITGARHLHDLTRDRALDHFVLFSSISSVWGSHGQTHYAAGNAFLDTLAHERHRLGLPALSVNWGPWNDAGMASATARDQLRRIGLSPLPPADATHLLGRLMANGAAQVTAAKVDWSLLRPVLTLRRPRPLLDAFAPAPGSATSAKPVSKSDILARLRAADATQRDAVLSIYLRAELARVLGRDSASAPINPHQGFFALGMDSLMAVELRTRLETDLEIQLPSTIAFDRATLADLQTDIAARLFPALVRTPAHTASHTPAHFAAPAPSEPIAIIGLGCRFPGGVSTPAEFWSLLSEGRHGAKPVPPERWSAAAHYHADPEQAGKIIARAAGFIDGVELFDHAFFNLYPREAASMDPQQRLLLETAWQALESAGLANEKLRGSTTGTFVGVSTNDYAQLLLKSGDATRIDAYFGTGNALNAVAGRLAYTFGLRGPTLATDTACSSSLVALHQACQSLRAGECSQALAAGVNLILTPEPMVALSRARMLSPDGRCKTFDASADGYGRGEGCGVVVLKRLSDARAAGDPVLAVITGSAINQDGASSGFTVPSGTAQQELIHRALAIAGRTPDELDYIEAHGTGTPLGDPIEINALAHVVGRSRSRPLIVASVKTNLGHLESAAGIAGIIKTVLSLQHDAIPAHLGFTQPSPHIPWRELPVSVPTTLTAWPASSDRPRVAGVSAFGFTGTNAHVILESALAAPFTPPSASSHLIPISARTPEALLARRATVLAWLDARPDLALADIARTLGAGRTHHTLREAYCATTTADLRAQLRARLDAPIPSPASAPAPLAFVCATTDSLDLGHQWQRWGFTPSLVLGEDAGLVAAGALAGIFSAEDAARLITDPAALSGLTLNPPHISFGHHRLGRIPDATAASPAWWRAALAGTVAAPGEALPPHRELLLTPPADPAASLRLAAELYAAGYDLDWSALSSPSHARHLPDAPTYPFQRRRHWIDTVPAVSASPSLTKARTRTDAATLLGDRIVLPGTREIRFATTYSDAQGFMAHHRIFGRIIASGAQHVALFIAAARASLKTDTCTATAITYSRALMLSEGETRDVQLVLSPSDDGATTTRVLSAPPQAGDDWLQHTTATLHPGLSAETSAWTAELSPAAAETPGPEFHRLLSGIGYTLGPSFCWVQSVRTENHSSVAVLAPPPGTLEPYGYDLHPGLIDSCFQLIGWSAGIDLEELRDGNAIYIPATIDTVRFHRRPSQRPLLCHVRLADSAQRRGLRIRGDLRLTEEDGTLIFEVLGFEARRAARSIILTDQAAPASDRFYELTWVETPPTLPSAPITPSTRALLGKSPLATTLGERLRARGDRITASTADTTNVVLFLDSTDDQNSADESSAASLLTLVQSLADRTPPPRLWLVTRGAQAVPGDALPQHISGAAAIGLGRIAALEHPALRVGLIDLDPSSPAGEEAALEHALFAADDENQVALRGPRRLAARLTPTAPVSHPGDAPQRLVIGQYGNLDTLALAPKPRLPLAPGEVEIEVRAVGLNFRDVLSALGLLKEHLTTLGVHSESDLPFGGECAGVIRAVGSAVTQFRPGDAVLTGLATGCMGSHIAVDARLIVAKPPHLSFAEAATLPVAYLTAYYALHTLARVQRGERVLIHAAAGGVGVAAIHVAHLLGAEVLATASPSKWPALRAVGVSIIGHSRQTDYAREFPKADVVLNALVGDHIPVSLDLLNPHGRFVEIGKLGIWTPEQVAARRPDVAYLPFDLVQMDRSSPLIIGDLLREISPHWNARRLLPLPLRVYPLTDAPAAFRFMAQAKHTGKVVLVRPSAVAPQPRGDGAYLITGGLGGLGLAIASWLAHAGSGTIILTSRRAPDATQEETLATLRATGARVLWRAADLSAAGAATTLITACIAEHGSLRGVFHAAGIIDDGLIRQQTPARLAAVFAPKARAAWELHTATLTQPLDFFVLFSSLAAVLGSPGQSTYAAANATLDALAQHRQRLGRPALSINWGPWSEAGMSARLGERDRARFTALGLKPFTNAAGITAFTDLLAGLAPQVAAVDLDRRALLASLGGGRTPPLLRQLASGQNASATTGQLATQLRATPAAERAAFIIHAINTRLATALGLAAGEALPTDRNLTSLGFDSLTAVELQSWIGGEFGVEIPMQQIAGFTLDGLSRAILSGLHLEADAASTAAEVPIEATLQADAQLPADFRLTGPAPALASPRNALLTGATGFLGAFLLHELLTTTAAVIHCVVRARTPEEGRERILENLRSYGLPTANAAGRLVIVPGDLASPQLGLDSAAFDQLAQAVDTIYHNGAWLNFFYPYGALRAANVLGTLEVLRLAVRGTAKPVHYVSTSGVFYSRAYRGQALPETDPSEHCDGHALGYSQTKWVAERLVTAAGERGLPVTIHRAPFITGHRETGAWNSDDFICRLVRGIIALGAMPDLSASMDIVPVDYVARGIIRLSQRPEAVGRRFHLCAPREVPWSALSGWLAEAGYTVQREPYATWLSRLPALRGTEHPLAPFVALFLEKAGPDRPTVPEVFLQSAHARLDGDATACTLAAYGLDAPVIDAALWKGYLEKLRSDGSLPAPTSTPQP